MPDVIMPRLSDSMEQGTIIRWLKADGDQVKRGEGLVEIETDKATVVYEADFSGTLAIAVQEGAAVPVGAVIGLIGKAEEPARASAQTPPASIAKRQPTASTATATPSVPGAPIESEPDGPRGNGGPSPERAGAPAKASPLARRVASSLGMELSAVSGSGPYGRILKVDVVAAAQSQTASPGVRMDAPFPEPGRPLVDRSADQFQELSRTQSVIARRMAQSRDTVPEFALEVDVDMSAVLQMRSELKALADPAPSLNDIIVKACAIALRRYPRANGSFAEEGFVLHRRVNVAIAVAAEDALVAPVVFDTDVKTLGRIAEETRRLIEQVRAGEVAPSDLDGGTFTVSNLGMFGIDRFEGIINAPQSAILCVGAVRERPVAVDGQPVIRPVASMTLACDHRILYGADAAQFLGEVRRFLEHPVAMVL
jgi:pyruvate dehydrogenase E2 component (dihydrolipoamide acetyltransferase)